MENVSPSSSDGSDSNDEVPAPPSEYEKKRLANIARNTKILAELNIVSLADAARQVAPKQSSKRAAKQ